MNTQPEIAHWASLLEESEVKPPKKSLSQEVAEAAKIMQEDEPVEEGFTDVRLPHDRVKHHDTGMEIKYWVAVDDSSELLTNYGWYVDQSLNKIPVSNNRQPSVTNDLNKAIELAKRAKNKWPDCYVMIGKDDHSRGVMTQKNHLRSGAIIDCWIPGVNYWRDGIVESDEIDEVEVNFGKDAVLQRVKDEFSNALNGTEVRATSVETEQMFERDVTMGIVRDIDIDVVRSMFKKPDINVVVQVIGNSETAIASALTKIGVKSTEIEYSPDKTGSVVAYVPVNVNLDLSESDLNEVGADDVLANWRKTQAEKAAADAAKPVEELPFAKEITITGVKAEDSKITVTYDITWSDGKDDKGNEFTVDALSDEFEKASKFIRSKSPFNTAIALLQQSFDSRAKQPITWMYYNPKTGVRASESQFAEIKTGKARLRGVTQVIDPAKAKMADIADRMNQQYGSSRVKYRIAFEAEKQVNEEKTFKKSDLVAALHKVQTQFNESSDGDMEMHKKIMGMFDDLMSAIEAYSGLDEAEVNEAAEEPFEWDCTDDPVVTVRDLKHVLANFKDNDVIDVCGVDGDPGYQFVAFWNAEYENSMVGSAEEQNKCYMRIGV